MKSSSKKKQRSADVQDFVKDLEIQAQRDEERKPYRRGGFPFRKVPGIIILAGGMGLLLKVFSRGARFEPQLFLIILGAAVLIIVGLVALLK